MSAQEKPESDDCSVTKPDTDGQVSDHQTDQAANGQDFPARSNPYCFPERHLFLGVTYNGAPVRGLPVKVDSVTQIKRIRNLTMRSDDVIIAAFPKCGTHWVSEILHMLMSGTTDYAARAKEFNMLEFMDDLTGLDRMDSPRLLNSHLYLVHLPEQVVEKKVKLVHLIRNPKDCAVSLYHHTKQHSPEGFTFDNFVKGYITEGYTSTSHQMNYLRQMSQFEKANPDHPVIHIHYEDLKKDPVPMIQELAQFVGVQASAQFCEEVATACGFDKLKKLDVNRDLPEHLYQSFPNGFSLYRKGVVGDWKNTFTVAQSEMFDQFLTAQEKEGQPYSFRWQ